MTELQLFSTSVQETATALKTSGGYVRRIILNNDGYGYNQTPIVSISTAPSGGTNATAVAITTSLGGSYSVKEILLTNAGSGYTVAPTVTISGGNGVGAAATCEIISNAYSGVKSVNITGIGTGYVTSPTITFSSPNDAPNIRARGKVVVSAAGTISQVLLSDAGAGYYPQLTIVATISAPPATGIGTYQFNEVAIGASSGTRGRVKSWDYDTKILKVGITDGAFQPGEVIVGSASSARYSLLTYKKPDNYDKYEQNDEIEAEADLIVDFSESNPFGNY